MKAKKGQIFAAGLVIITFISLLALAVTLNTEMADIKEEGEVGVYAGRVLRAYEHRNQLLFDLNRLAEYASLQAVYNLAKHGGLNKSNCSNYSIYLLVEPESDDCSPTKEVREQNFLEKFRTEMVMNYLGFNDDFKAFRSNFTYFYNNDVITGTNPEKLTFERESVTYYVTLSFSFEQVYDMSDYSWVIANSKILRKKCSGNENLRTCVENEIKGFSGWSLGQDHITGDSILTFEVESKDKYLYYNRSHDKVEFEPITIKFALDVAKQPPQPEPQPQVQTQCEQQFTGAICTFRCNDPNAVNLGNGPGASHGCFEADENKPICCSTRCEFDSMGTCRNQCEDGEAPYPDDYGCADRDPAINFCCYVPQT